MPKELLIYSPLWDFTAEMVVNQLNEVPESEDLTVRLNTPGGGTSAAWSIISKLSERSGKLTGIIDGQAMSMGAIMLVFFDEVIANDTSRIMFHKAAFPSWMEPSESELKTLKTINAQFKEKLAKKVKGNPGAKEFLRKVFESDVRNDVDVTPMEAKKLGIVDKIRKLEPKAEYIDIQIAAIFESKKETPSGDIDKSKIKTMDKATLKAENPSLYAAILADGHDTGREEGIAAERDRTGAWMAFNDIDPDAVSKGIKGGENLSQTSSAEFARKGIAQARTGDHKDDNADNSNQGGGQKTEAQLKIEAQDKEAKESLEKVGIKTTEV